MTVTASKVDPSSNILPEDFSPSESDVICGWARQNYHHAGNRRLRELIAETVPCYLAARSKTEKGKVILDIVELLRRESPGGVGLVRQNPRNGRWYFIGTEKAKDKIGHALRKAAQDYQKRRKSVFSTSKGMKRKTLDDLSESQLEQLMLSPLKTMFEQQVPPSVQSVCTSPLPVDNAHSPFIYGSSTHYVSCDHLPDYSSNSCRAMSYQYWAGPHSHQHFGPKLDEYKDPLPSAGSFFGSDFLNYSNEPPYLSQSP